MRTNRAGRAAGLAALFAVAAHAAAGQEAMPFESTKGYRMSGPAGWSIVSGRLSDEEKARLPEQIRNAYDPSKTDVIFMEAADAGGFRDNLNVVVVEQAVPANDDSVEQLKPVLLNQYKALFKDFELLGIGVRAVKDGPRVLEVRGNYELLGNKLFMHQMLVPGEKRTLVVTLTAKRPGADAGTRILEKSVCSIAWTP